MAIKEYLSELPRRSGHSMSVRPRQLHSAKFGNFTQARLTIFDEDTAGMKFASKKVKHRPLNKVSFIYANDKF